MTEYSFGYDELPRGITEDALRQAISRSGYPLQATVSELVENSLQDKFGSLVRVQEEWPYIDPDTSELRAIDIFAETSSVKPNDMSDRKSSFFLSLLIECKQSEMPYVFFLRGRSPSGINDFPHIIGLPHAEVFFAEPKENPRPVCALGLHDFLEIWDFPILSQSLYAVSASKAAWRPGGKLELTGEDAYKSLTFPLFKAASQLERLSPPGQSGQPLSYRFVFCLAVLKAPMYGVVRSVDGEELVGPVRAIRVCRIEPAELDDQRPEPYGKVKYYDAVHADFLREYLSGLIDEVKGLGSRIETAAEVISEGKGIGTLIEQPWHRTVRKAASADEENFLTENGDRRWLVRRQPLDAQVQRRDEQ